MMCLAKFYLPKGVTRPKGVVEQQSHLTATQ